MVLEALARSRVPARSPARLPDPALGGRDNSFTTVVRLGTEPAEVARTSIILAALAGPTIVVTTVHRPLLDELGPVDVTTFVAPTIEAALHQAARTITTEATIVLSASAFPLADGCRAAAALLRDGAGWVTGRAPSPNDDRYAPCEREMLARRLRSDARDAGATLWEPDATIVRTDLLAAYAIDPGRPSGSWLRRLEHLGHRGLQVSEPIALRAAPSDAPAFWPSQMMRSRAAAADLAGAVSSGPLRARALAAAALARALYAWPLALWVLVPLLIGWTGTFPLSGAPPLFVAALATTAVGRWSATRLAHGVELHPIDDARAATYDAPGSLLALPSALTGRIRVRRVYIPDQPLLWAALTLTLATTMLLLDRATTSDSGANLAAGAAVANLVLLWMLAIRAVGKRGWDRTVYRLAVDLPATVAGQAARVVEASPLGLAVVAPLDGPLAGLTVGSTTTIALAFARQPALTMHAAVASRRTGSGGLVLGLALRLEPQQRVDWIGGLFAAIRSAPPRSRTGTAHLATRTRNRPTLAYTIAFRVQMILVAVVSLLAASALALVLLGYQPLVISSASMRPTLQIGDVVVTSWVHVDQLRAGDIVSFDDRGSGGELITHRVRSIVSDRDRTRVETRGDANTVSEIWEVPRRMLLRRTVLEVPSAGGIAAGLGSPPVRDGLFASGIALAGGVVYTGIRRSRRAARAQLGAGLTARS